MEVNPKTPAERQASLKARRKAAGLVQVKVWVHPDWREQIKRAAFMAQHSREDMQKILEVSKEIGNV